MENPEWRRLNKSIKEKYVDPYQLQIAGHVIPLLQGNVTELSEVGMTVWDGSIIMNNYLERQFNKNPNYLADKRVLELGSGIGVTAIAAALLGAKVTATDNNSDVLEILKTNVKNVSHIVKHPITVTAFEWGSNLSQLNPPYDIILGADVVYGEGVVPLIQTLRALSTPAYKTEIIITCEDHNPEAWASFKNLAEESYGIQYISQSELDEKYQTKSIHLIKLKTLV